MSKTILRNIEPSVVLDLASLVDYHPGQVISRTLVQNKGAGLTLFAFDQGEQISSHESSGDAMVQVLDGEGKVTIDGQDYFLKKGESIVMPANLPHAVYAPQPFKMLLTVIFPEQ